MTYNLFPGVVLTPISSVLLWSVLRLSRPATRGTKVVACSGQRLMESMSQRSGENWRIALDIGSHTSMQWYNLSNYIYPEYRRG